jgi:hypothetical protein
MDSFGGSKILRGTRLALTRSNIVLFILLCLPACHYQAIKHDPHKAVVDANRFMKALYLDENPSEALQYCDEQMRVPTAIDSLGKIINQTKQERGSLKRLAASSYLMEQGSAMQLLYVGTYEKGVLYHRIVVDGNASDGYRVTGVWFQLEPYPQSQLRRNFETEVPVE